MNDTRTVTRTLLRGSAWTTLGEVLVGAAGLATSVLAARILLPHDFGLMKLVVLAMAILEHFSQTGFDGAIIQKEGEVDAYLDTAWTWQLLRGVLIGLALSAAGPLLARSYGEPVLSSLMLVAAGGIVVRSFANIGTLHFQRDLAFRTLFFIKLAQALLRVVVYIPAILWFQNVWALVIAHFGGCVAHTLVSYVAHAYRPKLRWDWPKLRELMKFGKWLTGMSMIGYVIGQGDDWFVSAFLGLTALGIYQLAYDVSNMPTINITHVVGSVGFPTYARLQNDRDALCDAFTTVLRGTLLLSGAATAFIYVSIPDFVTYVVGDKWRPAVPLVRILVLSGFVRSFAALAGPLFQGVGKPEYDFKMNLPRFLVTVALVWPLTAAWGLAGTSLAVLLAIVTCLPMWFYGVRELTDMGPGTVLRHAALPLMSSALLAATLYGVRTLQLAWFPSFEGPASTGIGALSVALLGYVVGLLAWGLALWLLGRFSSYNLFDELRAMRARVRDQPS